MNRSAAVAGYRLCCVALILAGLADAIVVGQRQPSFSLVNFLSYFTVLSNVIGAAVLLPAAVRGLRPAAGPPIAELLRGAAVLYLATTGIVYAVLLSGQDVATPPFANWVLHRVIPVAMVVDWLVTPPRTPVRFRPALCWLLFPAAYLGYTLLRGPLAGWYPYPFLDPGRTGGYPQVAATCLGIAVCLLALAALIVWSGRRQARR